MFLQNSNKSKGSLQYGNQLLEFKDKNQRERNQAKRSVTKETKQEAKRWLECEIQEIVAIFFLNFFFFGTFFF